MDKIKVIVAGGREFNNYALLVQQLDYVLRRRLPDVEIVSGCARGVDSMGEDYAKLRGLPVKQFPADWIAFGKSAGYKRNAQMAEYAKALVAFWDGKSKGTGHMIDLARAKGLKIKIINY